MTEMVSHPSHYNKAGRKECIVEMEEKYGPEITAIFCLTNAYKYLYRDGSKIDNPMAQDREKAKWYFNHTKKLLDKYNLLLWDGMRIEYTDLYLDIRDMLLDE